MKFLTKTRLKAGLCIAVISGALAPLPLIAQQASSVRQEATQMSAAADLVNGVQPPNSVLTSLSANLTGLPVSIRDAALTSDIPAIDANLLSSAAGSAAQTQCMAQAIYYEARSETFSGQKAVGEVVMNRVASKHFPNTICGVVFQGAERSTGCQFSFTCDGSMDKTPYGKAWTRSKTLSEHMRMGVHKSMTANATHYHTTDVNPKWASSVQPTRQIGSHKFYRFKTRREHAIARAVAP